MGAFGTDSRNRTDASNVQIGSSEGSVSVYGRGKGAVAAAGDVFRFGSGSKPTITFTTNVTDGGLFGAGASLLGKALDSQASLALDAQEKNAGLAETKITDGANITSKTVTIGIVIVSAVVALYYYFRGK